MSFASNSIQNEDVPPRSNYWFNHHIHRMVPAGSICVSLTVDEFKEDMHKQDEKTSLFPSGKYYGHYKSILAFNDICEAHATMMSLPSLFGFVPAHWQKAVDVMLEKVLGGPKINRLRMI
eukprot:11778473-Ditylum_brightwellii.AAC.1